MVHTKRANDGILATLTVTVDTGNPGGGSVAIGTLNILAER